MDLPYGITVEYRNGMGIVQNYSDKPYSFDLPKGAKIVVGEEIVQPVDVLVFFNNNRYDN